MESILTSNKMLPEALSVQVEFWRQYSGCLKVGLSSNDASQEWWRLIRALKNKYRFLDIQTEGTHFGIKWPDVTSESMSTHN